MKNNNNKYIQNKSRREIISANIDNFIDERDLTPSEFQEKMGMSKQDYYKKSKGTGSSYNEEDIMKAAKVLDVTVNDIYYDKYEKKELEVLKITRYDPIMAQQQVKIKLLNSSFEKPSEIISQVIGICVMLMVIIYFIAKYSVFYSLFAFLIPIYVAYYMKESFGVEKMYIINYLDDIYYEIKNEKNDKYKLSTILKLISIILLITSCLIIFLNDISDEFNELTAFLMYLMITIVAISIGTICLFAFIPKKLKKKIYQNKIKGYYASLVCLISIAITNVFATTIFALNHNYWYITILSILALIISAIEFSITSKKFNEYKLMYEEYNHKERELFPDDYKI